MSGRGNPRAPNKLPLRAATRREAFPTRHPFLFLFAELLKRATIMECTK